LKTLLSPSPGATGFAVVENWASAGMANKHAAADTTSMRKRAIMMTTSLNRIAQLQL
jgi:hypothetical protein